MPLSERGVYTCNDLDHVNTHISHEYNYCLTELLREHLSASGLFQKFDSGENRWRKDNFPVFILLFFSILFFVLQLNKRAIKCEFI